MGLLLIGWLRTQDQGTIESIQQQRLKPGLRTLSFIKESLEDGAFARWVSADNNDRNRADGPNDCFNALGLYALTGLPLHQIAKTAAISSSMVYKRVKQGVEDLYRNSSESLKSRYPKELLLPPNKGLFRASQSNELAYQLSHTAHVDDVNKLLQRVSLGFLYRHTKIGRDPSGEKELNILVTFKTLLASCSLRHRVIHAACIARFLKEKGLPVGQIRYSGRRVIHFISKTHLEEAKQILTDRENQQLLAERIKTNLQESTKLRTTKVKLAFPLSGNQEQPPRKKPSTTSIRQSDDPEWISLAKIVSQCGIGLPKRNNQGEFSTFTDIFHLGTPVTIYTYESGTQNYMVHKDDVSQLQQHLEVLKHQRPELMRRSTTSVVNKATVLDPHEKQITFSQLQEGAIRGEFVSLKRVFEDLHIKIGGPGNNIARYLGNDCPVIIWVHRRHNSPQRYYYSSLADIDALKAYLGKRALLVKATESLYTK